MCIWKLAIRKVGRSHTILRPFDFAGPHGLDPHKGEPPAPTDPDFLFSVIVYNCFPDCGLTFFETEKKHGSSCSGHIFLFVAFSLLCQLKSLGFVGQISSFVCLNLQYLLLNSTPQWKMWKSNQVDSFIILMMFV